MGLCEGSAFSKALVYLKEQEEPKGITCKILVLLLLLLGAEKLHLRAVVGHLLYNGFTSCLTRPEELGACSDPKDANL